MPNAEGVQVAASCRTCGTTYGDAEWANLEVVQRISPDEVGRLVLHWPAGLLIEVRACACCSKPIAAKRQGVAARGGST
jgi:hypothetical protein